MMMFDRLLEIALGIFGLSIVVLVHEAGHFFAARMAGITVETFSIGFGKRLAGFKRGETEFRLSLVPLGGYCRFAGEDSFRKALDENLNSIPQETGSFYTAAPWKRILVSLAGPAANIIFSILVLSAIAGIGYQEYYAEPRIILYSQWDDSDRLFPADQAGLRSGDIVRTVNGKDIDRFSELRRYLAFRPGKTINLEITRDGKKLQLSITPELDRKAGTAVIGVLNWIDPVLDSVETGSAADEATLQSGDRILSIDGTEVSHTVAVYSALSNNSEASHRLEILRSGRSRSVLLPPANDESYGFNFSIQSGRSVKLNVFQAIGRGTVKSFETLSSSLRGLRMLFLGIEIQNAVSGPLRLISDTGAIVAEGFRSGVGPGLLWAFELMSLISVSLAILNLLPIPVLDGGQIVLFVFELIGKKNLSPKAVYRYQVVGTIIVLFIAVMATAGDLLHFNSR